MYVFRKTNYLEMTHDREVHEFRKDEMALKEKPSSPGSS